MAAAPSLLHDVPAPYAQAWLPRSGGHELYVEQRGAPAGLPVLVLHGGPGSGCSPALARFFDPQRFRVILWDQRGAGRSRGPEPLGEGASSNSTPLLLQDMEALRRHLGIGRWLLAGGSWGATLALLYAAAHPQAVSGLLLRNPFLARREDLDWFFGGARRAHPQAWRAWRAAGAPAGPGELLPWLAQRFQQGEGLEELARVWLGWEAALARTRPLPAASALPAGLLRRYRLQLHYFMQDCFLAPGAVLNAAATLEGLPLQLLQGLRDHVCPPAATRLLRRALPASGYQGVRGVGHDPFAPAMVTATRRALQTLEAARKG